MSTILVKFGSSVACRLQQKRKQVNRYIADFFKLFFYSQNLLRFHCIFKIALTAQETKP